VNGNLWVGKFRSNDEFVVYDSDLQHANQPDLVFFFDIEKREIKSYSRTEARELFTKAKSSEATETIIRVYRSWQARMGLPKVPIKFPKKPDRKAYCWKCGLNLNMRARPVCKTCGWILCDCGSCGCNYPK
jgi:hypothetical protein